MTAQPKAMTWIGWILAALVGVLLAFSATMKLQKSPDMVEAFTGKLGYPADTLTPIAIAEIASLVLFLIPQTSVLGAILLTGYLGGATATNVRVEDMFLPPVVAGVVVWLSLFLRDSRIRALVPWRFAPAVADSRPKGIDIHAG